MASSPSPNLRPVVLDPKGDGLLYLPCPTNAAFRISIKVLSGASSALAELYKFGSTAFLTDVDDAKAVDAILKILHFIDPRIPEESITPQNVARIAKLSLEWKCNRALGSYPRLWLSALHSSRATDAYEPWKSWLMIARAFSDDELTDCIVNQHVGSMWRETGYNELEALRLCLNQRIVGTSAANHCFSFLCPQAVLRV